MVRRSSDGDADTSTSSAIRSASLACPVSISTLTACKPTLTGPNTVHMTFPSPVRRAAGQALSRSRSRAVQGSLPRTAAITATSHSAPVIAAARTVSPASCCRSSAAPVAAFIPVNSTPVVMNPGTRKSTYGMPPLIGMAPPKTYRKISRNIAP